MSDLLCLAQTTQDPAMLMMPAGMDKNDPHGPLAAFAMTHLPGLSSMSGQRGSKLH